MGQLKSVPGEVRVSEPSVLADPGEANETASRSIRDGWAN